MFHILEQFNPDAPLEILFDYVRIRFLTSNPKPVIEEILKLKMEYMLHEDYAFYSYMEQYIFGDIVVMVSPDEDKGCLLELKGKGCRQFENFLLAQQRTWFDFFMDVFRVNGVFKRVDLAIKDRKSTRLNSSHVAISYAVFCLKKKRKTEEGSTSTDT